MQILMWIKKDFWFIKADLKSGFYHLFVNENSRKFLTFHFEGEYSRFLVMPFGCNLSPYLFTKLMESMTKYLLENEIILENYVDDFLFTNEKEILRAQIPFIKDSFKRGGLTFADDKTSWELVTSIEFIGFLLDSLEESFFITEKKKVRVIQGLQELVENNIVTPRKLASALGRVQSIRLAIPNLTVFIYSSYSLLKTPKWDLKIRISKEI
jgi:hypothetical protein